MITPDETLDTGASAANTITIAADRVAIEGVKPAVGDALTFSAVTGTVTADNGGTLTVRLDSVDGEPLTDSTAAPNDDDVMRAAEEADRDADAY